MQHITINSLFGNYETSKLFISFPSLNNLIVLTAIIMIAVISYKNHKTSFLDKSQTDQLKGLAILLIIVSHLWFHVSESRAIPMLGDYSVILFLMLSGFGLTRSLNNRPLSLGDFVYRRLTKVMIPYWIVTILIIILDYIILNRSYSLRNIIATLSGINLNLVLRSLDYARWYITLLLIYYIAFFISNRLLPKLGAIILIMITGLSLVVLKHYGIFYIGKYNQAIAFPIGCLLAYFYNNISLFMNANRKYVYLLSVICILILILQLIPLYFKYTGGYLYTLTELITYNLLGLVFCFLMITAIGIIGVHGYISRFLVFCGGISYELYLIHGPILIKYNPFFNILSPTLITISFAIYLASILILAYWFNKLTGQILVSRTS